jgi:hypothetical protein
MMMTTMGMTAVSEGARGRETSACKPWICEVQCGMTNSLCFFAVLVLASSILEGYTA